MIVPAYANMYRQGFLLPYDILAGWSTTHIRQVDILCVRQPEQTGAAGCCKQQDHIGYGDGEELL